MNTLAAAQQPPSFFSVAPDNWKLAIVVGLIASILAAVLLPASASFWIVGAMMALVAAAFVVNAYRRRYYGGLLVAPAIAVLFVMNIFPLLWSLGLSFFAYQSNQQSIRFVGLWDTVAAYGLPVDEMTRGVSRYLWPLELPNRREL